MRSIRDEIRYALRAFARRPRFCLLVCLVIALGVGATTTVFSVVDQTVLRRPPFLHGERLVDVMNVRRNGGGGSGHPAEKILGWREELQVFERLECYVPQRFDVTDEAAPEHIRAVAVCPGLFDMLGVAPFVGRAFTVADAAPGAPGTIIVSAGFATTRFGTGEAALGREVRLDGTPHVVIGVMPTSFSILGREQAWLVVDLRHHVGQRNARDFWALGRLPSSLSLEVAQARAYAIADRRQSEAPLPGSWDVRLDEKRIASMSGQTRSALLALLAGVACLLVLTCVSAAQLLLARTAERTGELAVLASLGATRGDLIRSLLIELSAIGVVAGLAGVLVSLWAVQRLGASVVPELISMQTAPLAVDARVLLVALATVFVAIVGAGLAPAFQASRPAIEVLLRSGQSTATARVDSWSSVLVGIQVAFTVALLVAAVLTFRTMANVHAIDLGLEPEGVVVASLDLPSARYPTAFARYDVLERMRQRLASQPGVDRAAVAGYLTVYGFGFWDFETAHGSDREPMLTSMNRVGPGYFETMGIQLVAGRTFAPSDMGAPVIVVGRSLARRLWPQGDAVGAWLRDRDDASGPRRTVIGVVEDIDARVASDRRMDMQWYEPFPVDDTPPAQATVGRPSFVPHRLLVRTSSMQGAVSAVRRAITTEDPLLPVDRIAPATDEMLNVFAEHQLVQRVTAGFAVAAALLSAVGIFGVIAQLVQQRRREIGIRLALGATSAGVQRVVVGRLAVTIAIGAVIGLGGAVMLTRTLRAVLFGVSPLDAPSFALAVVAIVLTALAASWVPAKRAARISPATALRAE